MLDKIVKNNTFLPISSFPFNEMPTTSDAEGGSDIFRHSFSRAVNLFSPTTSVDSSEPPGSLFDNDDGISDQLTPGSSW